MRTEQVAELLARPPPFLDAPEEALAAVAREASIRTYRKGSIVVSEGDPADACYVIAEGSAKVFVTSAEGGDLILATLRPPDAFGVIALLDGGFRSASVEALEPLTLAAIARSTLLALLQREPTVADALLRSTGSLVRRLTGQAADLIFLDLEGRVAKLLVGLVEREGGVDDARIELDLGVTQGDLAAMVGGSRQSVNQILHALQGRGFLHVDGHSVTVNDLAALRRRGGM